MNAFYEHHEHSIRAEYRCFDRILLNGLIQPFQQPERVIGFFSFYRKLFPVTRKVLTDIADRFQDWVKDKSCKRVAPILEAPTGRRDEFVEPYFRGAKPDQVLAIIKAREPGKDYDCHRHGEGEPMALADRATIGGSVQLLRERLPLGTDVCAPVSVPALLCPGMPESASLAG